MESEGKEARLLIHILSRLPAFSSPFIFEYDSLGDDTIIMVNECPYFNRPHLNVPDTHHKGAEINVK